jgi:hypothetical protein
MKCHLCTNYIEIKTEPKVSNSTILLQLGTLSSSIKDFVISYQFTMMYASHGLHGRHMSYEQCFDFDLVFILLYIHIVTYAALDICNLYSYFYIRI